MPDHTHPDYLGRVCSGCQRPDSNELEVEERFSLGIYAGYYCDKCWKNSSYRDEGPEGFDPLDAGERYDDDGW